jgi:glycosyltransferase involved in cell wall biosynthesis
MNNLPKVTVIVPCYNVMQYVKTCIDSVLSQTYTNIELVLIDDGSTDSTNEVIVNSIKDVENVVYIRNKNAGVSNARNTGIIHSSGEYIMFIDSDDYISHNMIFNMYKLIMKYESDFVRCNIQKEYIDEKTTKKEKPVYSKVRYLDKEKFPKTIYRKILSTETINSVCFSLFKSNIIKQNNLFFREDVYNGEDAIFLMNYINNSKSIVYTPTPYYHYIIRSTGLTGSGLSME